MQDTTGKELMTLMLSKNLQKYHCTFFSKILKNILVEIEMPEKIKRLFGIPHIEIFSPLPVVIAST